MDRSIDNLEVLVAFDDIGAERESLYLFKINLVDISADNLDFRLVAVKLDVLAFDIVYVVDDVDIVEGDNLSAVFPVSLIAVVDFRIV